MTLYYSGGSSSFYDSEIHGKAIPIDCVEISKKLYLELFQGQVEGKSITADGNGFPYLVNRVVFAVGKEQAAEFENIWVTAEVNRVRDELEKVQDSDPEAIGTVGSWREYRKALRAWNENENFPNNEYRPIAPDAQE